jgi:hypothetical protein
MRNFQLWVASALLSATALTAVAPALAQTCACPTDATISEPEVTTESGATVRSHVIFAEEPPPPLPVYDQPPIPAEGYIWTPGYWGWNGDDHYWVPGTWVRPPRVGLLWTPGYWGASSDGYAYHRGYWGEHVGFYGGIDYGFGYVGVGFEGGRWDGDHFAYNRAVTNIKDTHITNVYNKQVTVINNTTNVSYNGPNGVAVKPTPAELAVAKEPHVARTAAQVSHVKAAAHTESAFAEVNKGKPPVAATAKAGDLKGAAVVPAKAAGGPLPTKDAEPKADEAKPMKGEATKEPKADEAKPMKGEATKEPKADAKPMKGEATKEPKADEAKPMKGEATKEPKADEAKPMKGEATKEPKADAKPMKGEPPKEPKAEAKPMKAEPMKAEPKAEGKKACGHPGEPACAK